MDAVRDRGDSKSLPVLPEEVPVIMPKLPHTRVLSTVQQLKALGDPLRARILGFIQYQPATAKHIADRLGISPSSIGHHLHVLEAADLVQVVARRSVRGTIANYYTRTAFFFDVDLPPEIVGRASISLDRITQARDELTETIAHRQDEPPLHESFLHFKLTPPRARLYAERLQTLVDAFLEEMPDVEGQVYDCYMTFFLAPPSLQDERQAQTSEPFMGGTEDHE